MASPRPERTEAPGRRHRKTHGFVAADGRFVQSFTGSRAAAKSANDSVPGVIYLSAGAGRYYQYVTGAQVGLSVSSTTMLTRSACKELTAGATC